MLIGTGFVTPGTAEWVRVALLVLTIALGVVDIIAMALMATMPAAPAHARADRSRRPIGIAVVIMLAIAITAVSTPPVIAHETMATRANQTASTVESFYRFYGMRHVSVTGETLEDGLTKSWVAGGRGRVVVSLTYVDVHGNHRDGSAVIARGRIVLFASSSTVSASPFDRSWPRHPMTSPYRAVVGYPSESR